MGPAAELAHWCSSQKVFAFRRDLPASRDLYHSTIYVELSKPVLGTLLLECCFGADVQNNGGNLLVCPVDECRGTYKGYRSCPPGTQFSKIQRFLREWDNMDYCANPVAKQNCNEFAREAIMWAESLCRIWLTRPGYRS